MPPGKAGHFNGTADDESEEGGDDVKSSWPLWAGLHTSYNGRYNGQPTRKGEPIPKAGRSPDCGLQLDRMKSESLVIADQHVAVNTFPGLVHTARHTMEAGDARSGPFNPSGGTLTKVCLVTGVKS